MKAFVVFLRIMIVGCLWCIVFTEGIRVIMLCNWHFDIFWPDHWRYLFNVWKEGWTARAPKEWAFVILLVTFIPMLITGWWTLSMVSWETVLWKIITFPLWVYRRFIKTPLNVITTNNPYGIVKRKSYKQIRPTGISSIRVPISDYGNASGAAKQSALSSSLSYSSQPSYPSSPTNSASITKKTDVSAAIDHALFKFDDGDDDFDLDIDSFEKADIKKDKPVDVKKSTPKFEFDDDDDTEDFEPHHDLKSKNDRKSNRERSGNRLNNDKNRRNEERRNNKQSPTERGVSNPIYEALQQKSYDVINNIIIKGTKIDFIGVSESEICLCLVDKEVGDWLADEEMFNGEEPLWFSESSHRVSPVCLLNNVLPVVKAVLDENDFTQDVTGFVVIQAGNIINAEDMFEVWDNMNIKVTRINRGSPKEIPLFSKTLEEADGSIDKKELGRLSKVLKNLR